MPPLAQIRILLCTPPARLLGTSKIIVHSASDVGGAWQLMSDEKTDFMNKTLYTLTLITALATPLIFLTGLFGMNFVDMDELVLAHASAYSDEVGALVLDFC